MAEEGGATSEVAQITTKETPINRDKFVADVRGKVIGLFPKKELEEVKPGTNSITSYSTNSENPDEFDGTVHLMCIPQRETNTRHIQADIRTTTGGAHIFGNSPMESFAIQPEGSEYVLLGHTNPAEVMKVTEDGEPVMPENDYLKITVSQKVGTSTPTITVLTGDLHKLQPVSADKLPDYKDKIKTAFGIDLE